MSHDDLSSPCADCGVETLPVDDRRTEWYAVTDEVWAAAGMADGYLCIGCLEARIGRPLTAADFADAPLNDLARADLMRYAWSWRTPRLVARLSRGEG